MLFQMLFRQHIIIMKTFAITAGIQCSCMPLMSICWRILKTIARWASDDLDRKIYKMVTAYLNLCVYLGCLT